MQDDLITPLPPEEAPAQTNASAPAGEADPDSSSGSDRVFDITDDNIAPAKEEPDARYFPPEPETVKPDPQPMAPRPVAQRPAPMNLPIEAAPAIPAVPTPPIADQAPRQPISIPLSDFTTSLQKAAAAPAPRIASNIINTGKTNPLVSQVPSPAAPVMKVPSMAASPAAAPQAQAVNNEDFFPKANDLKALRTYESDVAEVLAHSRASTASIAIAEAKKQEGDDRIGNKEAKESSNTGLKVLVIVISLILIVAGLGAGYYFYSQSALAPTTPAPVVQTAPSLIPADSQDVISIDGLNAATVLSHIETEVSKPLPQDSITEIVPIETLSGQKVRVSASEMLSLMQVSPPDILTRSLDPSWMLGIYTDTDGSKSVFVVAQTNFFQNAFAGMLQWESVMADDLKMFLPAGNAADIANVMPAAPAVIATSTAAASSTSQALGTSTVPAVSPIAVSQTNPYALEGHFEDRIVMNKDVRAFVTDGGQTLFLYSFIDNTKLVVAGSEDALKEILTRLENQAFVR